MKKFKESLKADVSKKVASDKKVENKSICPSCGEPLIFEGGCNSCKACGWSKCDL